MGKLDGKVAIVTGAAGGMGEAMARLFLKEGASVMATDIQEELLSSWGKRLSGYDGKFLSARHDVASESDWNNVVKTVLEKFGKIDILVNNAGVFPMGGNIENTSKEQWDKIISINLTGPFIGIKTVAPYMIKNNSGAIVNVASIAGLVGGNGPAYSASKGGLILLSKDTAVQLAPHKIRVNVLAPGGVKTPMTNFIDKIPGAEEMIKNSCPLGRMAEAMELAAGALFLASDESSFMTGADLVIDGGLIAR